MSRSDCVKLAHDLFIPSKEEDSALPPVILLHGMTSSRKTWMTIPQTIADQTKRKVYALDARNHGESDWAEEFDYYIMAKDVANFMNDANISKAILVGHSMGGKTAMVLAFSESEKVDKLVVEDISPILLPSSNRRFPFHYLKLMRQSLSGLPKGCDLETAREIIDRYIASHTPEEHRSKMNPQNASKTLPLKMTEKGAAWQANVDVIEHGYLNNPLLRKELDGFYNGETLFIYGTKSVYGVCEAKDKIKQLFPKAVFSAVNDATHLVHLEFPEEFSAKVVEFIGRK